MDRPPTNWKTYSIDALKASTPSAIAIGPFGSRMKSDAYVESGIPVIRGNNISDTTSFTNEFVYVSEETAKSLASANVFEGDLVFPHRGAIGQVGIVKGNGSHFVLSTSLMKLTCDRNIADAQFLFYFFRSPVGRHELLKNASTVGTPGIATPLTSLKAIRVNLPSLPEQRAIAHILGTLDDKIEVNRQMNGTLDEIARAIFRSWFVDFDPVRARAEGRQPEGMDAETAALFPSEFEGSSSGEIPRGWYISSLGELFPGNKDCVLTGPFGSHLHASDYRTEGTPLILVKHVNGGRIVEDKLPLVGHHKIGELGRYQLKPGDIVFTRVGAVGRSAFIYPRHAGWLISGQMLRVRVPNAQSLNARYLAQVYLTDTFISMVESYALGSTRASLNTGLLQSFQFLVPAKDIQDRFAAVMKDLDAQVQQNLAEINTLTELRDTLLPRLLSGELRVPDAASLVSEAI